MGTFRFADFTLDTANRRLARGGAPVDVAGRYFDALVLMAAHPGQLVSKDRFMDEVWRGVPVTDEALTQCMRALRKALGDDAANPRFIETVPKHGYRFIAPVGGNDLATPQNDKATAAVATVAAGTLAGGLAGLLGGAAYGFLLAGQPGAGAFSLVLVLMTICTLVALLGAFGVSAGVAIADAFGPSVAYRTAGATLGGLVIGTLGKMLSFDAFRLVVGQSPGNVTGGAEGMAIGAAVGFGLLFAAKRRHRSLRASLVPAILSGAFFGAMIPPLGGRMMAGSLAQMASAIPGSQLRLDGLLAASTLGAEMLLGAAEGALFVTLVAGGIELAARARGPA